MITIQGAVAFVIGE